MQGTNPKPAEKRVDSARFASQNILFWSFDRSIFMLFAPFGRGRFSSPPPKVQAPKEPTMEFYTLQGFFTHTKGVIYLLVVVTLIVMAGFWRFLDGRDDR